MKRQSGMTLIELVTAIIVLGMISAIAAPKFTDSSETTVTTVQNGTKDAMRLAYTIAVAVAQTPPTWSQYLLRVNDMTCGTANGICTSADFDKDTNADLQYQFYDNATCTNAITTGTGVIASFEIGTNATGLTAGNCVTLQ